LAPRVRSQALFRSQGIPASARHLLHRGLASSDDVTACISPQTPEAAHSLDDNSYQAMDKITQMTRQSVCQRSNASKESCAVAVEKSVNRAKAVQTTYLLANAVGSQKVAHPPMRAHNTQSDIT